jgi:hypothetical protein
MDNSTYFHEPTSTYRRGEEAPTARNTSDSYKRQVYFAVKEDNFNLEHILTSFSASNFQHLCNFNGRFLRLEIDIMKKFTIYNIFEDGHLSTKYIV